MKRPRYKTLRAITVLVPVGIVVVGIATNLATGTLSSFGLGSIALICPLGAIETMLASKTPIPQAVFSLLAVLASCLLLGKIFCDWLCPVPLWQKLKDALSPRNKTRRRTTNLSGVQKQPESARLQGNANARFKIDPRFAILAGACASTAAFGFPVFCLVCPIGLTFGLIIALWRLFGFQEVSILLIVMPILILLEVVFFKKWCSKLCPVGALLSLFSKGNRFFRPQVNPERCLDFPENGHGKSCRICVASCRHGINLHNADKSAAMAECTKCGECVDNCPTRAISMPFLSSGPALVSSAPNPINGTEDLDGSSAAAN